MKTVLATALGLSLLVSASAFAAPGNAPRPPHASPARAHPAPPPPPRVMPVPPPVRAAHGYRPAPPVVHAPPRIHQYRKGERLSPAYRGLRVSDWRARGLRGPARGQEWRQIDGRYLLVATATGVILDILGARY